MPALNYERAAMALCDASIFGDRVSAERWGIAVRTIQRYRRLLQTDDKLRQITQEYRDKQTNKWLEDMPSALAAMVTFMKESANSLSPSCPDHLEAITGALEAIADIHLTQTVVNHRLKNGED